MTSPQTPERLVVALVALVAVGSIAACDDSTGPGTPDGPGTPELSNQIVFYSERQDGAGGAGNVNNIFVMNADGSGLARLTDVARRATGPAVSPDGRWIAFVNMEASGGGDIYVMNAAGGDMINVTQTMDDDFEPAWSPDGSQLVFVSRRYQPPDNALFSQIFTINRDGTELRRLTDGRADDRSPSWSPDGARIAFASNRTGSQQIYLMDPDGANLERLTNNPDEDEGAPDWAPDGSRIVYSRESSSELIIMNADGTDQRPLTSGFAPVWSPNGGQIVFAYQSDLWVIDVDGGEPTNLTNDLEIFDYAPDWSR